MKRILAPENVAVLAQLVWSRVLLVFDFDGTLAPIVAERGHAAMRPQTQRLLERVCALYPSAIISGRSRSDVSSRLGSAAVKYVVGNHGVESVARMVAFEREIGRARSALEDALHACGGLEIENKRYSLAIHYRKSRHKREDCAAIREAVATLPVRMRVIPGKLVVNVVPERAPNKGVALLRLRAREHADTALYVGDDVTDEDVFELDQPGRLLTVRVGESKSSAAAYFVRDQREVDALLQSLVAFHPERCMR